MTIAQRLKIQDFPFIIKDSQGRRVYYEDSTGYWAISEYSADSKLSNYIESTDQPKPPSKQPGLLTTFLKKVHDKFATVNPFG